MIKNVIRKYQVERAVFERQKLSTGTDQRQMKSE
jgi:hypothetical protein